MKKSVFLFLILTGALKPALSAELFSLEEAFKAGLKNSPAIEALKGEFGSALSSLESEEGRYDWGLEAGVGYRDADLTRVSIFLPSNIKETSSSLGLNKMFSFGGQFSISAEVLKTEDNSTFSTLNKRYESALQASLTQPLLQNSFGKESRARLKGIQMRIEAVRESLYRGVEEFALEVARRYWNIWTQIQLEKVAEEGESDALEFLRETKRLIKVGLREADDVDQAEAAWLERKAERLTVDTAIKDQWRAYQAFLGIYPGTEGSVVPPLSEPPEGLKVEKEFKFQQIEENRSDWRAAKLRYSADQTILEGADSRLLPELNVTGGYTLLGLDPKLSDSVDEVRAADFSGWNVGMALKHRFGQNSDRAEITRASADLARAKAALKDVQQRALAEAQSEKENFETQMKKTDLFGQIEGKRKNVAEAFAKKFKQGRISTQERLRAMEDYRQAQYRHRLNQSQLVVAKLRLELSRGVLLQSLGIDTRDALTLIGWAR